jgi:hypothetical protein
MPDVSGDSVPPKVTLRRDPSTGVTHYGSVRTYPYDNRVWATLCRRGSGIDTVFWSMALDPDGPTCMWCVAKAFT